MIRLGMHRDELEQEDVDAASFHPFKDEWWVVGLSEGQPCLATFTDKVCVDILVFKSIAEAMERFIERWSADYKVR